ncbi:MAG: zinc-ribbon domain-containing protein, partial [Ruminococcaceae bacterium]|nr:zinc-ribbon domain-containing protein [Oscillospiraceae bacterium]
MKCPSCQAENADNARFCYVCGMELKSAPKPAEVPAIRASDPAPAKKFPLTNKQLAMAGIALGALLVIILLICAIAGSASGGGYVTPKDVYDYQPIPEDDITVLFYGGKQIGTVEGTVYTMDGCHTGDAACCITMDGTLYVVRKNKIFEAAEDIAFANFSANGSAMIVTDTDDVLYYLSLKNCELIEITDEAYNYDISADGKTVVYSVYDDGEYTNFIWSGGKITELSTEYAYVHAADGKNIVGVEADGKVRIYNWKKDKEEKLSSGGDSS